MNKQSINQVVSLINDYQVSRSEAGRPLSPATITALNELVCFIVVGKRKEKKSGFAVRERSDIDFGAYEKVEAKANKKNKTRRSIYADYQFGRD